MANPAPDSKTPALVAVSLVIFGLVIAALQGFTKGSLMGGVIAALGTVPGCYGMWKGIQQETQAPLALSVGAVLLALAVGGLLIVLRIISWLA